MQRCSNFSHVWRARAGWITCGRCGGWLIPQRIDRQLRRLVNLSSAAVILVHLGRLMFGVLPYAVFVLCVFGWAGLCHKVLS